MGKSLLGKGRSMCEVPEGKEPDVFKEHRRTVWSEHYAKRAEGHGMENLVG